MNATRPPRSLSAALLQFGRFFGRRQFRRLATTTARTRRVRKRPRCRGRCGSYGGCGCDDHWFEGGWKGLGFDGWREDFPPLFDEPLEDQSDDGATVWGPTICGGSERSNEQFFVV